jgi:hypothetical protein
VRFSPQPAKWVKGFISYIRLLTITTINRNKEHSHMYTESLRKSQNRSKPDGDTPRRENFAIVEYQCFNDNQHNSRTP